ncbi:MAG: glycerol-3-phosphate acyltransferase [Deltaproteobacteria bacterium]|nr:glycerol-3-phosphate acyltransferase [Deltaproteobacteria bacterium]
MYSILFPVTGYLVGSVSFGLLWAKRRGVDLRAAGSGNVGATNVGRALGRRTGRVVLLLDALKGAAPTLLARHYFGADSAVTCATGFLAVAGHVWPIWHGFAGGKGAATGVGALSAVAPLAGGAAFLTYLVAKTATRRASLGSLGGTLVGLSVVTARTGLSLASAMALGITLVVWLQHAPNLRRLLRGEEPPEGAP